MSEKTQQAIEATVGAFGTKTTATGVGFTVGGWAFSSEFAVLMGILLGVAGLIVSVVSMLVNWYYKHKITMAELRLREEQAAREREAHAAKMGLYQ